MQRRPKCHGTTVIALEVSYNWEKVIQTAMTSFGLAILASIYPAYRATKAITCRGDEDCLRTVSRN